MTIATKTGQKLALITYRERGVPGFYTFIFDHVGKEIDEDLTTSRNLEDWDTDIVRGIEVPDKPGIWIWEGTVTSDTIKGTARYAGTWRCPTVDEAIKIANGVGLWSKEEEG